MTNSDSELDHDLDDILDEFGDGEDISNNENKDFNKVIEDALNNLNLQGDSGDDADADLDGILDSVMGELLSKEVLYEPLKELSVKYPEFLSQNKDKLSDDSYTKYSEQHAAIKQVLDLFDGDSDEKSEILNKMTKVGAVYPRDHH